jgi:hypothetical protein
MTRPAGRHHPEVERSRKNLLLRTAQLPIVLPQW